MSVCNILRNEDIIPQLERIFSVILPKDERVKLVMLVYSVRLTSHDEELFCTHSSELASYYYPLVGKLLNIPVDLLEVTSLELILEPDSLPVLTLTCHPTSKV